jgi:hypothetical protein
VFIVTFRFLVIVCCNAIGRVMGRVAGRSAWSSVCLRSGPRPNLN